MEKRKSNRIKDYDYSQYGMYFITICSKNMEQIFGEIFVGDDGNRPAYCKLSRIGLLIKKEIEKIRIIRPECEIEKYIIMPNHIHIIVFLNGGEGRDDCHRPLQKSIPNMVQGLKGAVTRELGYSPWQRSYYDHVIRNDKDYVRIWEYIENNPLQWNLDKFYNE